MGYPIHFYVQGVDMFIFKLFKHMTYTYHESQLVFSSQLGCHCAIVILPTHDHLSERLCYSKSNLPPNILCSRCARLASLNHTSSIANGDEDAFVEINAHVPTSNDIHPFAPAVHRFIMFANISDVLRIPKTMRV